jgi:hypothetical protein
MPTGKAITWVCGTCDLPVADGEGFVHVVDYEADRAAAAIKEWEQRANPSGSWSEFMPQSVDWRVSHTLCVPEEEQGYTWEIHRLRTLLDLLDFHFHCADKAWVQNGTNLNAFTKAAVDRFRSPAEVMA